MTKNTNITNSSITNLRESHVVDVEGVGNNQMWLSVVVILNDQKCFEGEKKNQRKVCCCFFLPFINSFFLSFHFFFCLLFNCFPLPFPHYFFLLFNCSLFFLVLIFYSAFFFKKKKKKTHPVRQIVSIRVGVVEKTSLLHHKAACVCVWLALHDLSHSDEREREKNY